MITRTSPTSSARRKGQAQRTIIEDVSDHQASPSSSVPPRSKSQLLSDAQKKHIRTISTPSSARGPSRRVAGRKERVTVATNMARPWYRSCLGGNSEVIGTAGLVPADPEKPASVAVALKDAVKAERTRRS